MVELEELNEFRFYKLEPQFPKRCTADVSNIYAKVRDESSYRKCGGLLCLHMKDMSVNMKCKHVGCGIEYEIPRICNSCGREHLFEDITCDTCEPKVIDIATLKVSIAEANKAIKKINRAFKQNLIDEKEWKAALQINQDEVIKCEKRLEDLDL